MTFLALAPGGHREARPRCLLLFGGFFELGVDRGTRAHRALPILPSGDRTFFSRRTPSMRCRLRRASDAWLLSTALVFREWRVLAEQPACVDRVQHRVLRHLDELHVPPLVVLCTAGGGSLFAYASLVH